ncbi:MAG: hypothetical protein PHG65_11480, partial [Kiritimatiellae bacterium]|nr:hypothetical protein [Kiritimatiellia bacterium]
MISSSLKRLKELLTAENVLDAAGPVYFSRGEVYAENGMVRSVHVDGEEIVGEVSGSDLYETCLYELGGELEGSCTCPLGERDEFCKHLVATGLVWIKQQGNPSAPASVKHPVVSDVTRLKKWLGEKKREQLLDLIVERCGEDGDFFEALLIRAAAKPGGDLKVIKQRIQQAYRISDFIDWRNTHTYYYKLDQVADTLRGMLNDGQAEAVIELTEYAMKRWETAIQCIDDSDGGMGMALEELHELHLEACRKVRPDPKKLAERLFKTCLKSSWNLFSSVYGDYADVFGETGCARYRDLVETEWNQLPRLKPGDDNLSSYGTSGWLSKLMIQFAKEDGDFERELEIMQRDLSNCWNFCQLAERC